ncbi:hypothetical protein [Kaarinaea lacus]
MRKLVIHPTSTAQWHSLVCEAENAANIYLDEELQSYLVFVLMRFLSKPDIAVRVLALDYIEGLLSSGQRKKDKLRDVGDVCLIHAGLFPKRARRKRVNDSYFIDLGSGAYNQLSEVVENDIATLYTRLSQCFVPIRDLLNIMASLSDYQQTEKTSTTGQRNLTTPADVHNLTPPFKPFLRH